MIFSNYGKLKVIIFKCQLGILFLENGIGIKGEFYFVKIEIKNLLYIS